jgi:cobalt-zinc-cadmium efflux system protein
VTPVERPASELPHPACAGSDQANHDHGGHGSHGHGVSAGADRRYLCTALALITVFMAVEVVVAFFAHSLALLADAGHMLTDAGSLAGAMWAAALAGRPARGRWTFGFKRAEILAAAVNGVTLLVVAALVLFEAVRRLAHPAEVSGGAVIAVAAAGVVVNGVATWVLAKGNRSSLNVEGAFQHLLTDTYAFLATLVAGVVIVTTGFRRADSIASLLVVLLMLRASWQLLRASGRVLLEAAPDGVDLLDVRAHLLQAPHVLQVHDLHAWVVTSDLPALSAHIVLDDSCFADGHAPQIWTTCSTACRVTSTWSTPPSSSSPRATPIMKQAPTPDCQRHPAGMGVPMTQTPGLSWDGSHGAETIRSGRVGCAGE